MNHLNWKLNNLQQSNELLIDVLVAVPIVTIINAYLYYRWMHSKTIEGVIDHIQNGDHYDKRSVFGTPDYYNFKAKIPEYREFAKLQNYINTSLPIMEKLADGQKIPVQIIDRQIDSLGMKIRQSLMDNYNGHFKATIISGLISGAIAVGAGALFSFTLGPESAFIGGSVQLMNFGRLHTVLYEYFNSDRKFTARELGWHQETLKQACNNFEYHYRKLTSMFGDMQLGKMKGGMIDMPSKTEASHTRLFADLLLRQIKAEAIVLGTIFIMRGQ